MQLETHGVAASLVHPFGVQISMPLHIVRSNGTPLLERLRV